MAENSGAKKKPRKVKGCYNCSQRRINCDRGDPCQKCIKKGLECSGLGVRYRFNDGVASRGKFAGSSIPVQGLDAAACPVAERDAQEEQDLESKRPTRSIQPTTLDIISHGGRIMPRSSPLHHLDHLDQRSRFLLDYFSTHIAPAMAPINTIFNGYRDIILPMSELDPMMRNAILASSASHLSLKHGEWKVPATKYHMATIRGLYTPRKSELSDELEDSACSNLSTMVLLLVEEMITANTRDFQIILQMIKSFMESQGGEEKVDSTPVGKFLTQQIRKMIMYSAPLISEEVAVKCLHQVSIKDLGFLYSCLDIYPEHSEVILKLADLVQRAVQIYLARASKAPDDDISILVQLFLIEASLFNAASPGGHILIWPFFIVGTECSLEEDRDFVTEQLKSLWRFTGFGNTLYAIELLNKIWHGEYGGCWTEVLGEKVQGFIM